MRDKVKIAGVQMNPKITKNRENLDQILRQTKVAAQEGADLIVFPECAVAGYVFASREEALPFLESVPGASTDKLAACCQELGVHVIVGLLEKDGNRAYNTAVLLGPEGIIGKYRKSHLPYLGVDRFLDAGDGPFRVYPTAVGNIGLLICYDCNFPEVSRVMALLGADILALPTNWPEGRDKPPRFLVPARAYENRVHFVAVNRVGKERGTGFHGHSKIVSSLGETLAEASGDTEEIIYAEVSLAEARQKRMVIKPGEFELDFLRHRRPDLYGEITKLKP